MKKINAFTLAEVLITLGIIGIVAAMTLPVLIQKNNNRVVETKLKKFYSSMNQAVRLAEVDYGDRKIWSSYLTNDSAIIWFDKYFAPYIKITEIDKLDNGQMRVSFPDGGAMVMESTRVWTYFPTGKCDLYEQKQNGICSFAFMFDPNGLNTNLLKNKGFGPYISGWDGNEDSLMNGCKGKSPGAGHKGNFCTALIQRNNWTIPDNYPYKVRY